VFPSGWIASTEGGPIVLKLCFERFDGVFRRSKDIRSGQIYKEHNLIETKVHVLFDWRPLLSYP
jgi:hypothetical protein